MIHNISITFPVTALFMPSADYAILTTGTLGNLPYIKAWKNSAYACIKLKNGNIFGSFS